MLPLILIFHNILADILPSHFGTNLTHFLGESVLNQPDFMKNIKGLKIILRFDILEEMVLINFFGTVIYLHPF